MCAGLAGGFGRLAASIAARTRRPLTLPLSGASLPRQRVEACLGLLSGTVEDVSAAVNRLGRACAGSRPGEQRKGDPFGSPLVGAAGLEPATSTVSR